MAMHWYFFGPFARRAWLFKDSQLAREILFTFILSFCALRQARRLAVLYRRSSLLSKERWRESWLAGW